MPREVKWVRRGAENWPLVFSIREGDSYLPCTLSLAISQDKINADHVEEQWYGGSSSETMALIKQSMCVQVGMTGSLRTSSQISM